MLAGKARMLDVARLAGVGTMTVSRVLNNSAPVSPQTRERVQQAIKKLNYRPNPFARSLRQARSNSIGIIVPNFYDPFFATCAHAISLVAKQRDYTVTVATSDEDAQFEFTEATLMVLNRVAGLAVIPAAMGKNQLHRPEFRTTRIVMLDRPIEGQRFSSVLVENRSGSHAAVKHLLDHGHKVIQFLGLSEKLYTLNERYRGYASAMCEAGLTPSEHFTCRTMEETCILIRKAISGRQPPTAFFLGNNLVTRNALHAFSQLKIKISDDVAIIGFDDFDMADIFVPAITVVRHPAQELGRVAAELLFEQLARKKVARSKEQVVLPVELVIRQSCGCNVETRMP
ncbi:Transcriptional regulator, LacI family [Acidisarcina polymorpha]|uniref:Transcriptional regulator, LacI family n=1 Tax=Acidisarcina polymorpha TaxID=2211140 RepID=A0A2Z5G164_9BACT|nr:LacI family DNA-binding transcriptional regulator [Acidisarcina polymorpha]AXC12789.1 Transcriptional regulator, LacI family [Acidisarcina polymorpha]